MGTTYEPDGMELGNGTWGTDADQNTALSNLIGPSCVEFKNTTPASDPYIHTKTAIPCEAGRPYRMTAIVQADSVAGGNTIRAGVNWYNGSDAYQSASVIYAAAVLPGANVWYELSGVVTAPAAARQMRPFVQKSNTAFTAYIDYLGTAEMPFCFWARRLALQTIADATITVVAYNSENYDYGSVHDGAGTFTAPADGVYSFHAQAVLSVLTTAPARAWFYLNGAQWIYGDQLINHAGATQSMLLRATAPAAYLSRGDTVDFRVWHNSGVARDIVATTTGNHFFGAKVE